MREPTLGDVLRELGKHGTKLDVLTGKVDRLDTVVTNQGEKLDTLTNDMEVLGRETRRRFDEFEELFVELPDRVAEAVERTVARSPQCHRDGGRGAEAQGRLTHRPIGSPR